MTDRPMLFSGTMIRANRSGLKTNTRRLFKGIEQTPAGDWHIFNRGGGTYGIPEEDVSEEAIDYLNIEVGDRIWAREEFSGPNWFKPKIDPPASWPVGCDVWYWADGNPPYGDWTKPKPAMHMPRWMSRLTLIVTAVKVERLRDISREDAIAEGLEWVAPTFGIPGIASTWNGDPRESYFALWDHINGAGKAAENPWVACYFYTVHHCNIDAMSKEAA